MKIVSLLPAATEIVAALGLLDQLVGISHECDFPPEVGSLPRVTQCPIYNAGLSSAEIDRRVRESMAGGESLYRLDEALLRDLQPDLVLSQALCDVCAIGYGSIVGALAALATPQRRAPRLLNLEPRRLEDLYASITAVAEAAGVTDRAAALNASLRARVEAVRRRSAERRERPRVLFLEWIDPLFGPGHWTPELIEIAGGRCAVGTAGVPSTTMDWREAARAAPEVVVIACCGYSVQRSRADLPLLERQPGWAELPAVRAGRVHFLDGSHYFSRPGPRLVDSVELLEPLLA